MAKKILLVISFVLLTVAFSGCGGGGGSNGTQYTLTVKCDGNGTVADHLGYAIVSRNYSAGTVVTLVPRGEGVWVLKNWTGEHGAEVIDNKIVMNGNKQITANFSRLTHNITISTVGEGTVTKELVYGVLSTTTNVKGEKIRLIPVAKTGWDFDHWEGDMATYQLKPEITVDSDKNITAVFSAIPSYRNINETAETQVSAFRAEGQWHKTTRPDNSQGGCWRSCSDGCYLQGRQSMTLTSRFIDLSGSQKPYLLFDSFIGTDWFYNDYYIEVSDDGGLVWQKLVEVTGRNKWETQMISLDAYKNKIIQVRFCFRGYYLTTSSENTWYIDNISIKDQCVVANYFDDAESDQSFFNSDGVWRKTTKSYHSGQRSWMNRDETNTYNPTSGSLTSVSLNLTGTTRPYLILYHITPGQSNYIEISTDNAQSWSVLKDYSLLGNSTWDVERINLTSYKNQTNLLIRFRSMSAWGTWYIDDIGVYDFQ